MSQVFKSLGSSTVFSLLAKPTRPTDVEMALNVLNLALSDIPNICSEIIENQEILKILIELAVGGIREPLVSDQPIIQDGMKGNEEDEDMIIRIKRRASYTIACCTSYARNMPLSAQTDQDRIQAIHKIANEGGFVITACDCLDSLEKPDHISDTLLLASLSILVEASPEVQIQLSSRSTTIRVLVQIASGDKGWSGNRYICIPKYFDEVMHVKDIALYILEKICIDRPACDRLAECNGARFLLSMLLPHYFKASQPQSGKALLFNKNKNNKSEETAPDKASGVEDNDGDKKNDHHQEEGSSEEDKLHVVSLITQECISRILISCINNSSEFGRQFYRLAIAVTPASSPSASAIERFFPLLFNGVSPNSTSSGSSSSSTIIQLSNEDKFASQRLALLVIRRGLLGPSARPGRTTRRPSVSVATPDGMPNSSLTQVNPGSLSGRRGSSRESLSSASRGSLRRTSSVGTSGASTTTTTTTTTAAPTASDRAAARRRSGSLSVAISSANSSIPTKADDQNKVLAKQVALSLCSHGLLNSLSWLLLSSHSLIRNYVAQILQCAANVASTMFQSSSSCSNTPRSMTPTGIMTPVSPKSPPQMMTTTGDNMTSSMSISTIDHHLNHDEVDSGIGDCCLIPLLEQGCVPIFIMSLVMLKKRIRMESQMKKEQPTEVAAVIGSDNTPHSGSAPSVMRRKSSRNSFITKTEDTSDECIVEVIESLVVKISTLLTDKLNSGDNSDSRRKGGTSSSASSSASNSAASTPTDSSRQAAAAITPRTPRRSRGAFSRQNSATTTPPSPVIRKRSFNNSDGGGSDGGEGGEGGGNVNGVREALNSMVITVGNVELRSNVAMGLFLLSRFTTHQILNPAPLTNPLAPPLPSITANSVVAAAVVNNRGQLNASAGGSSFSKIIAPFLPHFKLDYKVINAICDLMKVPKSYRMGIMILKCIDSLLLSPADANKMSDGLNNIFSPSSKSFLSSSSLNNGLSANKISPPPSINQLQNKEKVKAWDRYDLECKKLCLFTFIDMNCAVVENINQEKASSKPTNGSSSGSGGGGDSSGGGSGGITTAASALESNGDEDDGEDNQHLELKDELWIQFLERKGLLKKKTKKNKGNESLFNDDNKEDEDLILLICEEQEEFNSKSGSNGGGGMKTQKHSIQDKGVKMNCPSLAKISKASPFLATVIVASNELLSYQHRKKKGGINDDGRECTNYQSNDNSKIKDDLNQPHRKGHDSEDIGASSSKVIEEQDPSQLPRLYGTYRVWEEIMSHIASNGQTFREHSHIYSLDSLFSLLALSIKYHINSLSTLYTSTIITSHLDMKSSPTILSGAIKVKAYSLAIASFRNVLLTFESKLNLPYKRSSDEKWERKASVAISNFLCSMLSADEGVAHF